MKKKEDLNVILTECAANSRKAQEKLFKLYYGKMLYLCLRYFNDRDTAQEVVQEGFIKVYEKVHTFDKTGSFDSWISRLMTNTAIDTIRKNKKINYVEINDPLTYQLVDEDLDEFMEEKEISAQIALESIHELSPAYRTVFNLFVVEEYTHKEIAEMLGVSEGTSKSNLAKAKANLKQIIEKKLTKHVK